MKPLHLGTRITLWSILVVTASILFCGAAATLFVHHEEMEELDGDLRSEVGLFLRKWESRGKERFDWTQQASQADEWLPSSDPTRLLEVTSDEGEVVFRSKSAGQQSLPALPAGAHTIDRNGVPMRLVVQHESGITIRLAAETAPIKQLTEELAWAFVFVLPIGLAVVLIGAKWIARQALDPIRKITESAEQVSVQRLDQRVPVPAAQDEIHRLATVLNDTFNRLDLSFHQATRFSADASHELKTPLTILRTSVEALLHSPRLSDEDQDAVEGLLEQTKRLSSITENLLLLSMADAGKLTLDLKPGDLSAIVGMCVEDARILAEPHSISITAELPTRALAFIDRIRAAQIVMNLLDNAVKYNVQGGSVVVVLEEVEKEWQLSIINTGGGIPEDAAPNLFTRFFRVAHTSETAGHGLGLSLSRELARAHHGDIRHVRDAHLGLTRFVASFPSAETPAEA